LKRSIMTKPVWTIANAAVTLANYQKYHNILNKRLTIGLKAIRE